MTTMMMMMINIKFDDICNNPYTYDGDAVGGTAVGCKWQECGKL
jgi:hypothetical protein